jgi:hypothetical protein
LPDTSHAVPPPSTANTNCSLPNNPPRYIPLPTTLLVLWNPAGSIHVCASSQINPVLLGAGWWRGQWVKRFEKGVGIHIHKDINIPFR